MRVSQRFMIQLAKILDAQRWLHLTSGSQKFGAKMDGRRGILFHITSERLHIVPGARNLFGFSHWIKHGINSLAPLNILGLCVSFEECRLHACNIVTTIYNTYLHQPMVVGVKTTRIRFIDFDHRQKVFVRYQYLVLVVQNARQVDPSAFRVENQIWKKVGKNGNEYK